MNVYDFIVVKLVWFSASYKLLNPNINISWHQSKGTWRGSTLDRWAHQPYAAVYIVHEYHLKHIPYDWYWALSVISIRLKYKSVAYLNHFMFCNSKQQQAHVKNPSWDILQTQSLCKNPELIRSIHNSSSGIFPAHARSQKIPL